MAVINPILKPLKDPNLPLSYRPISLLSSLSKILEKIMNKRLIWFLESNKILSNSQYGCRKARSALMALSDLDSQIYEAEANHANLYSIFFDMENAFPRVWTHHICSIFHQLSLRGAFPRLLQNYLQKRTFCVRSANHHSSTHEQENGVPQGSPLSGTLFLLAINGVTEVIKPPHSLHPFL